MSFSREDFRSAIAAHRGALSLVVLTVGNVKLDLWLKPDELSQDGLLVFTGRQDEGGLEVDLGIFYEGIEFKRAKKELAPPEHRENFEDLFESPIALESGDLHLAVFFRK